MSDQLTLNLKFAEFRKEIRPNAFGNGDPGWGD